MRVCAGYFAHCVLSGRDRIGSERKHPECIGENLTCLRIVIYNESPDSRQIGNKSLAFLVGSNTEPSSEMEGTAHAGLALSPDRALHHLNQSLRDGESQPGTTILSGRRSVCLCECLEQPAALLLRHADATVAD